MHPVKRMRKDVGFSVRELAEYTGLAPSTISGIEAGKRSFKTNVLVAGLLAEAFDCEVSDLFAPEELSHLGRPPLTGTHFSVTTVTTTVTVCVHCNCQQSSAGSCMCD